MQTRLHLGILLFAGLAFFASCKKMDIDTDAWIKSKSQNDFLKHSREDEDLEKIISDMRGQLAKFDFSEEFIRLNGMPLWDSAIDVKKSHDAFTLYVPTKKTHENRIASFFVAKYADKNVTYFLYNRDSYIFHPAKSINLTQEKCEKLIYYFDYSILKIKDTLFLKPKQHFTTAAVTPTSLSGHRGANTNRYSVCFWITHQYDCGPLPRSSGYSSLATEYCYYDEQICIDIDDGGGGGGACPWYNPNCTPPPAPVTLNPSNSRFINEDAELYYLFKYAAG